MSFSTFGSDPWEEGRVKKLEDISIKLAKEAFGGNLPSPMETTISATPDGGYDVAFVGPDGKTRVSHIDRATLDGYVTRLGDDILGSERWDTAEDALSDLQQFCETPKEVIIPPGSKLLEWSHLIFPKKFVERDIAETIHDMQREYIESIGEDRKWHPKWVCARGYMSYGVCVFCGIVGGVGKRIFDAWKGVNPS